MSNIQKYLPLVLIATALAGAYFQYRNWKDNQHDCNCGGGSGGAQMIP